MKTDCRKAPLGARRALGPNRNANRGFTLIEIMIVVVIIGVLAAIAMTSYEWATIKSRRAAAAGCVQEGAQYMERYRTTNMTYVGAALPACSADLTQYGVVLAVTDAMNYTITATPTGRQLSKDTECEALSINQLGERDVSGSSSANPGSCW